MDFKLLYEIIKYFYKSRLIKTCSFFYGKGGILNVEKVKKVKRNYSFFSYLMITLLSTTQPIFAASGTGKWVGGQFASFIKTTDNANTQYGVLLRRLIN